MKPSAVRYDVNGLVYGFASDPAQARMLQPPLNFIRLVIADWMRLALLAVAAP